jgi:hypothetical protein
MELYQNHLVLNLLITKENHILIRIRLLSDLKKCMEELLSQVIYRIVNSLITVQIIKTHYFNIIVNVLS